MGRPHRAAIGGMVYHVLNRAHARWSIFEKNEDFTAWEEILVEGKDRYDMRILAFCVMPNHWHLILWPKKDADLSRFVGWVTLTHTQRWHANHGSAGTGHIYRGRFKSFPVQDDDHFLTVCRYVERNPLRANLVERAEQWRWSSAWRFKFGSAQEKTLLSDWPVPRPRQWVAHVNKPQVEGELKAIRRCIQRGQPFGEARWTDLMVKKLGLETTIRPRGRPRKNKGS